MRQVFIGRQPILNRRQHLFGYELLFRSGRENNAAIVNQDKATAHVIAGTLNDLGFMRIVGNKKGFINVNLEILSKEFVGLLPPENTVFEILEDVSIDKELIDLCRYIKTKGYRIALDDFQYTADCLPLLNIVDYIKLDIRAYENKALIETVNLLKRHPPKLLAEKVETAEEFRSCNELGFRLFQGYFFARPTIIEGQRLSPSQMVLFELFNSLSKEEPVDIIERLFKREPELDFKLLRLINSAGYYRQTKIASIRQAIVLLGYRQLQRWVSLMLFAGDIKEIGSNPILEKAAIRGIMMGLLTKKVRRDRDLIEAGFIAGILSMTDVLLHMPIDTIVSELNITEEIALALTERKGVLGRLLLAIEKAEDADLEVAREALRGCGLDLNDLMTAETDAILEYGQTEYGL